MTTRHANLFFPPGMGPEQAKKPSNKSSSLSTTTTSSCVPQISRRRITAADLLARENSSGSEKDDIRDSDDSLDNIGHSSTKKKKKQPVTYQSSQPSRRNIGGGSSAGKKGLDTAYISSAAGYSKSGPSTSTSQRAATDEKASFTNTTGASHKAKGKERARDDARVPRPKVVDIDPSSSSDEDDDMPIQKNSKKVQSSSRSSRKSASPLKTLSTPHYTVNEARVESNNDSGLFVLSQSSQGEPTRPGLRRDREHEPASKVSSSSKENYPAPRDESAAIRKRHEESNRQSTTPFQSSSRQSRQPSTGKNKPRDDDDYQPSNEDDAASMISSTSYGSSAFSGPAVSASRTNTRAKADKMTPKTKRMLDQSAPLTVKSSQETSTLHSNAHRETERTVKKVKQKQKEGKGKHRVKDDGDGEDGDVFKNDYAVWPAKEPRRAKPSAQPKHRSKPTSTSSSASSSVSPENGMTQDYPSFVVGSHASSSSGSRKPLGGLKHSTATPHLAGSRISGSSADKHGKSRLPPVTMSSTGRDDQDDDDDDNVMVVSSISTAKTLASGKNTTSLSDGTPRARGVPTKPGKVAADSNKRSRSNPSARPTGNTIQPMPLAALVTSTKAPHQITPYPLSNPTPSVSKKAPSIKAQPVVEISSSPLKRRREDLEDASPNRRRDKRHSYDDTYEATQMLWNRAARGSQTEEDEEEEEEVDVSHDSIEQGGVLCPFCDRPLPVKPSRRLLQRMNRLCTSENLELRHSTVNPFALRLPVSDTALACKRHRDEVEIIPVGLAAGYPSEDQMDWNWIKDVVEGSLLRELRSIAKNIKKSSFRTIARQEWREKGARKMANVRNEWVSFHQELPGFYGQKGFRIIMDILMRELVKPGVITSEDTHPLDLESYLRRVLVPEAAIQLIKYQLKVDISTAAVILAESRDYGAAVFGEEESDLVLESKMDKQRGRDEKLQNIRRIEDVIAQNGRGAEAFKRGLAIMEELHKIQEQ